MINLKNKFIKNNIFKTVALIVFISFNCNLFAQENKLDESSTCPFKLTDKRPISRKRDNFTSPKISPDGKKVVVTKYLNGIYLIDIDKNNDISMISEEKITGSLINWSDDGNFIQYRRSIKSADNKRSFEWVRYNVKTKKITVFNNENYTYGEDSTSNKEVRIIYEMKAKTVIATDGTKKWIITKEPGSYSKILLSPDKSKVFMSDTRMYLYNINGTLINSYKNAIGSCWSPDSKYILYYIPADNGEKNVSSDIFLCTSDAQKNWKLTDTPDNIEIEPDWSKNGTDITFYDEKTEQIYIAKLSKK